MVTKKPEEEKKPETSLLLGVDVTLQMLGRIYGSLPKDENLLTNWIASKANRTPAEGGPVGDEDTLEEKVKTLGLKKEKEDAPYQEAVEPGETYVSADKDGMIEEEERVSCGFRTTVVGNKTSLVIRDFQVKAAIGVAASTMKLTVKTRGLKPNLREGLQIRPQHIPMTRDEKFIEYPDGQEDFIGHVMTPLGRRSILKRCDYVEEPFLKFKIFWVAGLISPVLLQEILTFAGTFNGLSSQRRFEAGKYKVVSCTPFKAELSQL